MRSGERRARYAVAGREPRVRGEQRGGETLVPFSLGPSPSQRGAIARSSRALSARAGSSSTLALGAVRPAEAGPGRRPLSAHRPNGTANTADIKFAMAVAAPQRAFSSTGPASGSQCPSRRADQKTAATATVAVIQRTHPLMLRPLQPVSATFGWTLERMSPHVGRLAASRCVAPGHRVVSDRHARSAVRGRPPDRPSAGPSGTAARPGLSDPSGRLLPLLQPP